MRLIALLLVLSLAACAAPTLRGTSSQKLSATAKMTQLVMLDTAGKDTPVALSREADALQYRLSTRLKERGISVLFHSTELLSKGTPQTLGQYLQSVNATHFLTVYIPKALVSVGTQGGKVVYQLAKKYPLEVRVHEASTGSVVWRFSAFVDASGYLQTSSGLEQSVEAAMQADGLL